MTDIIDISQRVERGADLLDDHDPQWVDNIDLGSFNIASGESCILGQLYGEFGEGVTVLFDHDYEEAVRHGFDVGMTESDIWGPLEAAWVGLITVRRSRTKVAP